LPRNQSLFYHDRFATAPVAPLDAGLALFGVIMVPMSLWAFNWAESYAKRTGKLKRMG